MAIKITVRDCTVNAGPRAEDRPGFDADRQVIHMVNRHRETAGQPEESAVYEQIPELPKDYIVSERRVAQGMGARAILGFPALVLGKSNFLPLWLAAGIVILACAWAIYYGVEVHS